VAPDATRTYSQIFAAHAKGPTDPENCEKIVFRHREKDVNDPCVIRFAHGVPEGLWRMLDIKVNKGQTSMPLKEADLQKMERSMPLPPPLMTVEDEEDSEEDGSGAESETGDSTKIDLAHAMCSVWPTVSVTCEHLTPLPLPVKVALVRHNQAQQLLRETSELISKGSKERTHRVVCQLTGDVKRRRLRLYGLMRTYGKKIDRKRVLQAAISK
jgi:hypothetical protein